MNVHIYCPEITKKKSEIVHCPSCRKKYGIVKKSLHLLFFYEWYGPTRVCMRCGRRWSDGEWMPLQFYKYARKDNIRSAKRMWREK
jgi:hypothetical protein